MTEEKSSTKDVSNLQLVSQSSRSFKTLADLQAYGGFLVRSQVQRRRPPNCSNGSQSGVPGFLRSAEICFGDIVES